jgi:hypothetical protein
MIQHYANMLKIKIEPLNSGMFLGGDHMPFHGAGFESCCLCSPLGNEIHSPSDVKEKIIPRVLLDAVEIVKNIIANIERNVKFQMET